MKLFYLGPEGTFTHQAAMTAADQFATLGDFDLIALPDVPAIMQAVQSRQGWGVIAWENNVEGYVVPNLDALIDAPNAAGFARISVDVAFNAFTVRGAVVRSATQRRTKETTTPAMRPISAPNRIITTVQTTKAQKSGLLHLQSLGSALKDLKELNRFTITTVASTELGM